MEPRREPGRAGAEGGLRRPRDVRQPALAAARPPEDRLGQDRAVPQPPTSSTRRTSRSRSLPTLEESRIALWSARGDLVVLRRGPARGRAPRARGEPRRVRAGRPRALRRALRVWLVCAKSTALSAHGFTGLGIAGESRRREPVERLRGLEIGARIEWRWDRFSFALTDFYGYQDVPYADALYFYERSVDPATGRPLDACGEPLEPDTARALSATASSSSSAARRRSASAGALLSGARRRLHPRPRSTTRPSSGSSRRRARPDARSRASAPVLAGRAPPARSSRTALLTGQRAHSSTAGAAPLAAEPPSPLGRLLRLRPLRRRPSAGS